MDLLIQNYQFVWYHCLFAHTNFQINPEHPVGVDVGLCKSGAWHHMVYTLNWTFGRLSNGRLSGGDHCNDLP